jgi:Mn2+/Fe2+ NRAMP family transporter
MGGARLSGSCSTGLRPGRCRRQRHPATSIGLAVAAAVAGVSVFSMLIAASVVAGFGTPIGLVLLVGLARDPW